MSKDNRILIVESTDVAEAIVAVLAVLAERVRSDRVLQRQLVDALAPIVTIRSDTADEPSRSRWFER